MEPSIAAVLFDFDGTLSLIREGWPDVMIPMMVQILQETGTAETQAELAGSVEDFVMRLNGRQRRSCRRHRRAATPRRRTSWSPR